MPGKYEGTHPHRDQALHAMATEGWANRSGGDVQAPTGFYWLLTNTEAELGEVRTAFAEFSDDVLAECVGTFIITEDSQGFVTVQRFVPRDDHGVDAEQRARVTFDVLERDYAAWGQQP